jgi:hypothetical protein
MPPHVGKAHQNLCRPCFFILKVFQYDRKCIVIAIANERSNAL